MPDINCKAQGYIFALAKIGILSSLRSLDRKDQSNSTLVWSWDWTRLNQTRSQQRYVHITASLEFATFVHS